MSYAGAKVKSHQPSQKTHANKLRLRLIAENLLYFIDLRG
jgi:hypothetical protein